MPSPKLTPSNVKVCVDSSCAFHGCTTDGHLICDPMNGHHSRMTSALQNLVLAVQAQGGNSAGTLSAVTTAQAVLQEPVPETLTF